MSVKVCYLVMVMYLNDEISPRGQLNGMKYLNVSVTLIEGGREALCFRRVNLLKGKFYPEISVLHLFM